jgi:endonuclease/exonuclease/phosphatase family metal-dependent hydrolase
MTYSRCAVIMNFLMTDGNKEFLFGVTSIHLAAKTNNVHIRKAQLLELYTIIYQKLCLATIPLQQMFIMGDFNFHEEKENELISNAYEDVWTLLHGNSEGIQFFFEILT